MAANTSNTIGENQGAPAGAPRGAEFEAAFPGASARATDTFIALLAAGDLATTVLGDFLRPHGLSVGGLNTLGILAGAGEPLPPHVISERLLVTRGTVTGLLDSLEKHGLVRRTPHPDDRRKLLIELTEGAATFGATRQPLLHRAERAWMAGLTDDEQETLAALLHKLLAHLRRVKAGELPGDAAAAPPTITPPDTTERG